MYYLTTLQLLCEQQFHILFLHISCLTTISLYFNNRDRQSVCLLITCLATLQLLWEQQNIIQYFNILPALLQYTCNYINNIVYHLLFYGVFTCQTTLQLYLNNREYQLVFLLQLHKLSEYVKVFLT